MEFFVKVAFRLLTKRQKGVTIKIEQMFFLFSESASYPENADGRDGLFRSVGLEASADLREMGRASGPLTDTERKARSPKTDSSARLTAKAVGGSLLSKKRLGADQRSP